MAGVMSAPTSVLSAAAALSTPTPHPRSAVSGARKTPAPKFRPNAAVITSSVTATMRGPANRGRAISST